MPYLLDNKALFFHTPKTGGTWIRRACHESGIRTLEIIYPLHHGHKGSDVISINDIAHMPPIKLITPDSLFTFSFIRHPETWLQSVFRHHAERGWGKNVIEQTIKSTGFNDFVRKYTTNFPGLIGRNQEMYCNGVNFVGKYENIAEDLIKALNIAGLKFDENKLRGAVKTNVSDHKIRTEYSERNLKRLYKAEAKFIHKHYPETINENDEKACK